MLLSLVDTVTTHTINCLPQVMALLRSMEYKPYAGREVSMPSLLKQIGMGPFDAPSVFG